MTKLIFLLQSKIFLPKIVWSTHLLEVVQGLIEMAANFPEQISKYCRKLEVLEGGETLNKEYREAEIELIKEKRAGCDRRMNLDKKKQKFENIEWRNKPRKKINL